MASAGGQTTGHALLAAVTGLDDAALTGALRPAVTANVLRPHAGGYTFRHELIREAVHEDLLPGEHGGCTAGSPRPSTPTRRWCRRAGPRSRWPTTGTRRTTRSGR